VGSNPTLSASARVSADAVKFQPRVRYAARIVSENDFLSSRLNPVRRLAGGALIV
jgi:hypothetical protein